MIWLFSSIFLRSLLWGHWYATATGNRARGRVHQPLHLSTNGRPWTTAIPSITPTSWRPHRTESSPPSISSTISASQPTSTTMTFPPTFLPSAFLEAPSLEPTSTSHSPSATPALSGHNSRAPSQFESNVPSSQLTQLFTSEAPTLTSPPPTTLPSIGNEASVSPTTSSPSSRAPSQSETNAPSSHLTLTPTSAPPTALPSIGTEQTTNPTASSPPPFPSQYPSIPYPPTNPSPQPSTTKPSSTASSWSPSDSPSQPTTPSADPITPPPSTTFSIQQCVDSIGGVYGSAESIGDGWCDDHSLSKEGTLFDLNSQLCGFDGGDCCIQSCNRNTSIYECRISGVHCKDTRYMNQSIASNFSMSILATNVTTPLGEIESNAVFLLGLQYQIQDDSDASTHVTVISSVTSNFTTMFGRPVVIVIAVATTYSETLSVSPMGFLARNEVVRHSEIPPGRAQMPALERSVRLAAVRVNSAALVHVVLCRNGIGAESCILSGNPSVEPMSRGHVVQHSCQKYEDGEWNTLYRTPSRFPGYAALIVLLALLWGLTAGKCSFYALRMKVNSSMNSESLHDTVFFLWMLTVASLLRFIYFVWLISWPTLPSLRQSSNEYSSTFSFIACREFLILNYDRMMSLDKYAPGAYHLIIGWFYCTFVTAVLVLLQNENRRGLEEERRSSDEARAISNHCNRVLRFLATFGIGTVAVGFMVVTAMGLMLLIISHLQQGASESASSAATISLLVVQSLCGLLLCGCCVTGFFIQSTLVHRSSGRQRSQQENCSLCCTEIAALCVVLGCALLVSANESVLYHAASAFPFYSLVPRVLELALILKIMSLATVFDDRPPRMGRSDPLHFPQQQAQSSFRQMNIDGNVLPSTAGRPSSNRSSQLFFDRFMDAESHLYPKWSRYWRDDEESHRSGDRDASFHEICLPPSSPQLELSSHQPHLEEEITQGGHPGW